MAIAKIHAIKSTVKKSIDYITNPDKTILPDGTQLVSSFGCATETADIEFNLTANLANELNGDYSKTGGANNLAYHMVQSFALEDNKKVTPEEIHELGKQFVERFLQGKHEYVIATHVDKGHIHNHIIFNATSHKDYKKFRSQPYKTVAKIREISDKICEENGLSVIQTKGIGKSYKEWQITKSGEITWKDTIKNKIDEIIPKVNSFKEFVSQMKSAGFDVKQGKHISFKAPEQERYVRGKRIGENYTKDKIIERISTEKNIAKNTVITIDKSYIFKTLTDGFILRVPNQDYYVYLNGDTAKLKDDKNITATLTATEYSVLNKGLQSAGTISTEILLSAYGTTEIKVELEQTKNENGEIPLSEYIKNRQLANKEKLHRAAKAIAYSRTEGVIYYSDYSKRIKSLKDQSYETKHTLIKLDDTVESIKSVGKLLITYNKYLPVKQELDKLKFAKFTRKKFENKHQAELASFEYVSEQLQKLGVDPNTVNKDMLIGEIKANEKIIKEIEEKADKIFERIERLNEAQSVVDDFISDTSRGDDLLQFSKKQHYKKDDINL